MSFFPDIKLLVVNVNLALNYKASGKKRLVRKQSSLFLHGASGSGKTTMLEKSTGKSPEQLQTVARTIGEESHILEGKDGKVNFVIDHGGEQISDLIKQRLHSLNLIKPMAILLLLDHAPRGKENDPMYACPKKGELPDDEGNPVRLRFEQHKKAIDELTWVFATNPELGKRCRLVLPIVNKRDAWENMGYTIHIFTDWYFNSFIELTGTLANKGVKLYKPIPLSGKWEGFGNTLDIIRENAGEELFLNVADNLFFNLTVRIPESKKS